MGDLLDALLGPDPEPAAPRTKLDAQQVADIRRLYGQGWRQVDLAARLLVTQPQISKIVRGLQWPQEEENDGAR